MTGGLRDLSPAQCLTLLRSVRVGRVGVSIEGLPAILPVNFLVLGGSIVFRSAPGAKLEAASGGAIVAFEADSYAADGAWGWSVLVRGAMSEITRDPAFQSTRVELLRAWPFPEGGADRIVRIEPSSVSGKGFGVALRALAPAES